MTVPQVNIQVFMNTNITSRIVSDPASEALIIIDDPATGNQNLCPSLNGCAATGVGGSGVNFKGATIGSTVYNVYQARNAGTASLSWLGVPIDPPGTTGVRTIRITNVRANASQLGTSSTLIPTQITMFISVTPPQSLPVNNPTQTVAFVSPGLTFSLRTADNSGTTSGVTFLQCVSNNAAIAADNTAALTTSTTVGLNGISFLARFAEGFASSFKKRNVAVGASADVSPAPTAQDSPGGICNTCTGGQYFTETGFYQPAFTTNGAGKAGLADFGTRLMIRFASVPAGAQIFVGVYENGTTAAGVAGNPTATPPVAAVPGSRLRLVSTDASGNGAFSAVSATSGGNYAPVSITGGSGVAVYEVMTSNPLSAETIDVPVVIAYAANTTANSPGLGTATVTGSFAPLSTVITQSTSAPIPRFADVPTSKTGFTINACSTNLLFPFVSNTAGFDTGIAIANTSADPFGTKTQQGACILNYYGTTTGGGAAPAAATTDPVLPGTELVFSLMAGGDHAVKATPGFQGYIIAQCAFQYAHGFAFISDIGAQKTAEGYLALVLDSAASTLPRSKTASEPLGQ
jgi:hypothetical protein